MTRIEHFAIFAKELKPLKDFYVEVFGLRVIVDNSQAPVAGYFLADDHGTALEIIERPPGVPGGETRYICHLAFHVDDFDAARATLAERGVRFETESEINNETMRTVFFADPEANRCQIVWRPKPLGTS